MMFNIQKNNRSSFEQHGNVCCGRGASIERASAGKCSFVSRTDGCERRHLGRAPTPVDRGVTTHPVVAVTNGFVVSFTCRFRKREGSCPTAVNLCLSVSCVFRCVVRLKSERVFFVVFLAFSQMMLLSFDVRLRCWARQSHCPFMRMCYCVSVWGTLSSRMCGALLYEGVWQSRRVEP